MSSFLSGVGRWLIYALNVILLACAVTQISLVSIVLVEDEVGVISKYGIVAAEFLGAIFLIIFAVIGIVGVKFDCPRLLVPYLVALLAVVSLFLWLAIKFTIFHHQIKRDLNSKTFEESSHALCVITEIFEDRIWIRGDCAGGACTSFAANGGDSNLGCLEFEDVTCDDQAKQDLIWMEMGETTSLSSTELSQEQFSRCQQQIASIYDEPLSGPLSLSNSFCRSRIRVSRMSLHLSVKVMVAAWITVGFSLGCIILGIYFLRKSGRYWADIVRRPVKLPKFDLEEPEWRERKKGVHRGKGKENDITRSEKQPPCRIFGKICGGETRVEIWPDAGGVRRLESEQGARTGTESIRTTESETEGPHQEANANITV